MSDVEVVRHSGQRAGTHNSAVDGGLLGRVELGLHLGDLLLGAEELLRQLPNRVRGSRRDLLRFQNNYFTESTSTLQKAQQLDRI